MTAPIDWTIAGLRSIGFEGFIPIGDLEDLDVPAPPGVYVIARQHAAPKFLPSSPAGRFKGRDPSVSIDLLESSWVPGAEVIYIGKATAGLRGNRGLRARLNEYLRFGAGAPIGHWGGRFIWQLEDAGELLVAWKLSSAPTELESEMIRHFADHFGVLPFANLRR